VQCPLGRAGSSTARHGDVSFAAQPETSSYMLELVRHEPDWLAALGVAFTRPPGVPERRKEEEDPWTPDPEAQEKRPRRIADDLAWLRQAFDEPERYGLQPLGDTAAVAAWEPDDACAERLGRLRDRRVLDAAGFLLHEEDAALLA
jgi:hypothetical protein